MTTDTIVLGTLPFRRPGAAQNIAVRCQEFRENFGRQLVESIIDAFIPDVQHRLAALRFAVNSHDASLVADEAHGLRGSCQNLGAHRLGEICQLMEERARRCEMASLFSLVTELETVWRHTLPYLEEEKTTRNEFAAQIFQMSSEL